MVIMNRKELKELKLNDLKKLAKEKEIKVTGLKKEEIIDLLSDKEDIKEETAAEETEEKSEIRIIGKKNPDPSFVTSGILTVMEDGYGFIRGENFETGDDNVFVSPTFIKKFRLRTGDHIIGKKREAKENERYGALIYIDKDRKSVV